MKADEARKLMQESIAGPAIEPELARIHAKIRNAAKEGKSVTTYLPNCQSHIADAVLKRLRADGFAVKYVDSYDARDPRETSYYTVSW